MTAGESSGKTQPARRRKTRPYKGLLAVQSAAVIVGSALLLLGILGFVPWTTTDVDQLRHVGSRSGAMLFGMFQVSLLHNLIHIALGLAGLALARSFGLARLYLLGGGLIVLGLWLFGLLVDRHSSANVLALNNADNWLHFGLGVSMLILGLTLAGTRVPTGARGEILVPEDSPD